MDNNFDWDRLVDDDDDDDSLGLFVKNDPSSGLESFLNSDSNDDLLYEPTTVEEKTEKQRRQEERRRRAEEEDALLLEEPILQKSTSPPKEGIGALSAKYNLKPDGYDSWDLETKSQYNKNVRNKEFEAVFDKDKIDMKKKTVTRKAKAPKVPHSGPKRSSGRDRKAIDRLGVEWDDESNETTIHELDDDGNWSEGEYSGNDEDDSDNEFEYDFGDELVLKTDNKKEKKPKKLPMAGKKRGKMDFDKMEDSEVTEQLDLDDLEAIFGEEIEVDEFGNPIGLIMPPKKKKKSAEKKPVEKIQRTKASDKDGDDKFMKTFNDLPQRLVHFLQPKFEEAPIERDTSTGYKSVYVFPAVRKSRPNAKPWGFTTFVKVKGETKTIASSILDKEVCALIFAASKIDPWLLKDNQNGKAWIRDMVGQNEPPLYMSLDAWVDKFAGSSSPTLPPMPQNSLPTPDSLPDSFSTMSDSLSMPDSFSLQGGIISQTGDLDIETFLNEREGL